MTTRPRRRARARSRSRSPRSRRSARCRAQWPGRRRPRRIARRSRRPSGNGAGATVFIKGVVYEKTLARTAAGREPARDLHPEHRGPGRRRPDHLGRDLDLHGRLHGHPQRRRRPAELRARRSATRSFSAAHVTEFFSFTQLSSPRFVARTGTALNVDAVIPPVDVEPASRARRRQHATGSGSRACGSASRPARSSPTVSTSSRARRTRRCGSCAGTARSPSGPATRSGSSATRTHSTTCPASSTTATASASSSARCGLKSLAGDNTLLLPPSRTFATVTNALVGGLNFSFNKYRLETTVTPTLAERDRPVAERAADGRQPARRVLGRRLQRREPLRLPRRSVRRLRLRRQHGLPAGVRTRALRLRAAGRAEYQERLGLIAEQIVDDLHAPDILLVQEAEDQDICSVAGGALVCGRRRTIGTASPTRSRSWRSGSRRRAGSPTTRPTIGTARTTAASSPRSCTGPTASSCCRRPRTTRCSAARPTSPIARVRTPTTRTGPEPEVAERAAAGRRHRPGGRERGVHA